VNKTKLETSFDLAKRRAPYRRDFMLYPPFWRSYGYPRKLTWQTVPFAVKRAPTIPDHAGVYAFLIQPGVAPILDVSYLVYVGETVSLKRRFRAYLNEAAGTDGARIQLYALFKMYRRYVHFSYAELPAKERKAAEDALLLALTPPINKKLPATIAGAERAF
jgi:hypothetical protein